MNIRQILLILGLSGTVFVLPAYVFAQSPTPGALQTQKIADLHTQCDSAVAARLASLNSDSSRINGLAKLSSDQKTKFSGQIQTNVSGLNSQKAKCDADVDLTTLRTDYKNVFLNFRIYAVFLPQTNLLVATDTMGTTTDKLQDLYNALQTRVQQAGNPSNLTSLLADMQSKIGDAKNQYNNAENLVMPLTPQSFNSDPTGTKTIFQNARNDIKTGAADLKAAFQDAQQIRAGLKLSSKPSATP
jgi:hypothetical protein